MLAVALLTLIYSKIAQRSFTNAALIRDSGVLIGVVDAWRKAEDPKGQAIEKLFADYGSTRPFVYTNAVKVGGTNLVCVFAIQDAAFAEQGKLAITLDGTIIWIGENSSRIVPTIRRTTAVSQQ